MIAMHFGMKLLLMCKARCSYGKHHKHRLLIPLRPKVNECCCRSKNMEMWKEEHGLVTNKACTVMSRRATNIRSRHIGRRGWLKWKRWVTETQRVSDDG